VEGVVHVVIVHPENPWTKTCLDV